MNNEAKSAGSRSESLLRIGHPIVGYALLAILAAIFLYGGTALPFGSLRSIGPGFLPTVLAAILMVMSLAGIAMEWNKGRESDGKLDLRPLFFICLAILLFALTVRRFGLIPASVIGALVAGFAEKDARLVGNAIVAVLIGLLVWLIFIAGLDLSVPAFRGSL